MGPGYYSLKAGVVLLALATASVNSGLETTRIANQIMEVHHGAYVMVKPFPAALDLLRKVWCRSNCSFTNT